MTPEAALWQFQNFDRRVKEYRKLQDEMDDIALTFELVAVALAEEGKFEEAYETLNLLVKLGHQFAQGLKSDLDRLRQVAGWAGDI